MVCGGHAVQQQIIRIAKQALELLEPRHQDWEAIDRPETGLAHEPGGGGGHALDGLGAEAGFFDIHSRG
jgi:hypothetical protein